VVAVVAEGGEGGEDSKMAEAGAETLAKAKEEVPAAAAAPHGNGLEWPDRRKVVARLLMLAKLVSGREEQVRVEAMCLVSHPILCMVL
jgi:hypothetical protein